MEDEKDEAIRQAVSNLRVDGIYINEEYIEEYKRKRKENVKIKRKCNNDK